MFGDDRGTFLEVFMSDVSGKQRATHSISRRRIAQCPLAESCAESTSQTYRLGRRSTRPALSALCWMSLLTSVSVSQHLVDGIP